MADELEPEHLHDTSHDTHVGNAFNGLSWSLRVIVQVVNCNTAPTCIRATIAAIGSISPHVHVVSWTCSGGWERVEWLYTELISANIRMSFQIIIMLL